MNSSLTEGKPRVKIKNKRNSNRILNELIKLSDEPNIKDYHYAVEQNNLENKRLRSSDELYDDDDDDDDDDEDADEYTLSLPSNEDHLADEVLNDDKDKHIDIGNHPITKETPSENQEEKYEKDQNFEDSSETEVFDEEKLDITIENKEVDISDDTTNKNNENNQESSSQTDEEKHVQWNLPLDHDESSEHIYSYMDTLDKQTALMTMNIDQTSNEDEIKYAKMLCIPTKIGEEDAGYALVDQGASRALIRRSKLLTMKTKYPEKLVSSHCVLSSSGTRIPITSRFKMTVYTQGHYFGEVMFYVVEDTADADICCDIVLGRVALAKSQFPHIDTITGSIYNPIDGQYITCSPAVTDIESRNGINKLIIVPEGTNYSGKMKHQSY